MGPCQVHSNTILCHYRGVSPIGPQPADGKRLYELVERYWALGHHRTGTSADHATADWMSTEMSGRALRPRAEPVPYDAWSCDSHLTCDGAPIEHLVVPHQWHGELSTQAVHVATIDPKTGGRPDALDEPVAAARASGSDAGIFATKHPDGSLVAINRELGQPPTGFPTILVAGRDADRVHAGRVELSLRARTAPGSTTNVVARNSIAGDPMVLTTPLTGWFGCAGERGTGIAVLLHLIEALADIPLLVVATGGHELGWFGAHRWVDSHSAPVKAVVHVGASIAVVDPGVAMDRPLARSRIARTSVAAAEAAGIEAAMTPTNMVFQAGCDSWMGEGQAFSKLGVPMLSMSGAGRDFHCPEDTPERATTPAALATTASAIAEAARALYETT